MSKRMVDLQVENGKVTSIDGHEISDGGGSISGDTLMNVTKDSTTITRTLDTDGKVKLDVVGGSGGETSTYESKSVTITAKQYEAGDFISVGISSHSAKSVIGVFIFAQSSTHGKPTKKVGDAVFIPYAYPYYLSTDNNKMEYGLLCIKAGTVTEPEGSMLYLIYSY